MLKVDLSTYDNSWYQPGSLVKRTLWHIVGRIFINTYLPIPMTIKRTVLSSFGAKLGKGVIIKPKVNIKYPWFLEIGDYSWVGEKVWIDNLTTVKIGANCCLSQGAMLLSGNHDFNKSTFDLITKEIVLEDGVWVAVRSIVTGGVTMQNHSMLAGNSVLSKGTKPYEIWRGNPAEYVKNREIVK
ncbi:WcaF family extracellular polysaccharide biosynthesis acetyltransferase [Jiulongibacter sp. NS-SX5]|uniref:WcaF family extracellular polysaccharide biosynthesis acetyltransferase n=1 Tax=Jiulongibacter sp. NS-SX5 TaxID=3463854 RepID=UPI0040597F4F